jgi:hypothetical protein
MGTKEHDAGQVVKNRRDMSDNIGKYLPPKQLTRGKASRSDTFGRCTKDEASLVANHETGSDPPTRRIESPETRAERNRAGHLRGARPSQRAPVVLSVVPRAKRRAGWEGLSCELRRFSFGRAAETQTPCRRSGGGRVR